MTYSRASYIGLVFALVVFVFLWNRKLIPGLLLLGICSLPVLPDTIFNRILTIFNLEDTSTSSRFPLYQAPWPCSGSGRCGGPAWALTRCSWPWTTRTYTTAPPPLSMPTTSTSRSGWRRGSSASYPIWLP